RVDEPDDVEEIPDYALHAFLSKEGYLKKITPQSLRMSGEHKLKSDDEIISHIETTNDIELLFFTNKAQVYKCRAAAFEDTKTSAMGEYVPAKLGMEEGESIIKMVLTKDYKGFIVFCFENGKAAKVPLMSYQTKQNRKKLISAFCDKSKVVNIIATQENQDIVFITSVNRALIVNTSQIPEKTTKNSVGVQVQTLKKNQNVKTAKLADEVNLENPMKYRTKNIPAAGAFLKEEDIAQQLILE
ncbi:MAG: DNA gyrase C-terminal beta-propeller domain-containing protein, partial [Oscillospiraceae bacterium]